MDELIKALDVIKAECEKNSKNNGCDRCPLGNNFGECSIADSGSCPRDWDIYHPGGVIRLLG